MSFFFSLIGLLNVVLLWPLVLTLHFTGLEVITWNRVPWIELAVAGSLSLCNYLKFKFFSISRANHVFSCASRSGQLAGQLWTSSDLWGFYSPGIGHGHSHLGRYNMLMIVAKKKEIVTFIKKTVQCWTSTSTASSSKAWNWPAPSWLLTASYWFYCRRTGPITSLACLGKPQVFVVAGLILASTFFPCRWGRHLNQHHGLPTTAPVDLRTGYISRSHLRSPSGRVRWLLSKSKGKTSASSSQHSGPVISEDEGDTWSSIFLHDEEMICLMYLLRI